MKIITKLIWWQEAKYNKKKNKITLFKYYNNSSLPFTTYEVF